MRAYTRILTVNLLDTPHTLHLRLPNYTDMHIIFYFFLLQTFTSRLLNTISFEPVSACRVINTLPTTHFKKINNLRRSITRTLTFLFSLLYCHQTVDSCDQTLTANSKHEYRVKWNSIHLPSHSAPLPDIRNRRTTCTFWESLTDRLYICT